MNLKKNFIILSILISFLAIGFAAGPNFGNLGDSNKILDNAQSQGTSFFTKLVTFAEIIISFFFLFAIISFVKASDEEKRAKAKKWMINIGIGALLLGIFLGYLYS